MILLLRLKLTLRRPSGDPQATLLSPLGVLDPPVSTGETSRKMHKGLSLKHLIH